VTHALKEIPAVNAEIDGTDIIYKNYCHIGVAVGTDKGLVVPVVRDADQMSHCRDREGNRPSSAVARDGKLSMADMQGGTFTISNGGVYGSLMSSPILNAPQSGILGMHKIQERPMAVERPGGDPPMMYLALSYDHRIVDGKEAGDLPGPRQGKPGRCRRPQRLVPRAACTVWEGPVYAISVEGAVSWIPARDAMRTAGERLLLPDFGAAVMQSQAWQAEGITTLPGDVFRLKACQE
jgi:hypothetical protein